MRTSNPEITTANDAEAVALHGDFSLVNFLVCSDSDRRTVIDWSTATWLGAEASVGPRELEIAQNTIYLCKRM